MILFDDLVEILDLADFDRGAVLRVIAFDGGLIGLTAVNGIFSGTPWRRIAFVRKRSAAS